MDDGDNRTLKVLNLIEYPLSLEGEFFGHGLIHGGKLFNIGPRDESPFPSASHNNYEDILVFLQFLKDGAQFIHKGVIEGVKGGIVDGNPCHFFLNGVVHKTPFRI